MRNVDSSNGLGIALAEQSESRKQLDFEDLSIGPGCPWPGIGLKI